MQHFLGFGSCLGQFSFLNTFLLSDVEVNSWEITGNLKTGSPQEGRRSTFSGTVNLLWEVSKEGQWAGQDVCPICCPRHPAVYLPAPAHSALSYSPPPCAALEVGCWCCLAAMLCLTLLWPWLLCPWNFPGKNTRVGRHFLLQGLFPTQESNLGVLLGRKILPQSEPLTWEAPEVGMEQSHQLEELQIEWGAKDRWDWETESRGRGYGHRGLSLLRSDMICFCKLDGDMPASLCLSCRWVHLYHFSRFHHIRVNIYDIWCSLRTGMKTWEGNGTGGRIGEAALIYIPPCVK